MMEYFSNASKIDLIVWALTVGLCVPGALRLRKQEEEGKSKIGRTKESTAGSSIRVTLAIFGHVGATVLPTLIYWTVIPWNGFRQPEWMTKYALPSPPDVFGIDGVVVGRAVGLLGFFASRFITNTSFKALGDQYHPIGIREKHKLVDSGPYAYVRHPIYSGGLVLGVSLALLFWWSIPLYTFPLLIAADMAKVPIEEKMLMEDPMLGKQYQAYMRRVPYKVVPYVW